MAASSCNLMMAASLSELVCAKLDATKLGSIGGDETGDVPPREVVGMVDGHTGDIANFVEMVDDAAGGAPALAKRRAGAPPAARTAGTQIEPMYPNQVIPAYI